jgi:hypothetical protein
VKHPRPETVQTGVRLPQEMLVRLKQSPDGVSEEIRRRLARTFDEDAARDAVDPETRDLIAAVAWMAGQVCQHAGIPGASWHNVPGLHEALAVAVQTYLQTIKPPERISVVQTLTSPDDPPTLGRAIARHYVQFKALEEKTLRELRERFEGKKP